MSINEQNNGVVVLDGTTRELPILGAFVGSSAAYWIKSAFPCTAVRMTVLDSDVAIAECSLLFHVTRGMWRGYFDGSKFAANGEFVYQVEATDYDGSRSVCGRGVFRVYAATATSSSAEASAKEEKGE